MNKLTIIILTYNEERHIKECIESVRFADEILIIDSGSVDKTLEIAEEAGARVVTHPMTEGFAAQRNFAMQQTTTDWILFLDADERMTPLLANEIKEAIVDYKQITAFKIPRRNHFLGKWIKNCGWYPDYSLRLMKKGKAHYTGLVHEHLVVDGLTSVLKQPFIHYTYSNIEQYLAKLNKYTSLAALEMKQKGKKSGLLDIGFRPAFTFFKFFLLRKGFLDGIEGLVVSLLSAFYVLVKYVKLYYLDISDYKSVLK